MLALTNLRHVRSYRPHLTARGIVGALFAVEKRYRARVHLRELDDSALKDIGITRADVADELRRPLIR